MFQILSFSKTCQKSLVNLFKNVFFKGLGKRERERERKKGEGEEEVAWWGPLETIFFCVQRLLAVLRQYYVEFDLRTIFLYGIIRSGRPDGCAGRRDRKLILKEKL